MKVSALADRLAPVLSLLQCPLCQQSFTLTDGQVQCASGHSYDLSAKGYLNLAPGHNQRHEKYDAALFNSRGRILQDGFYQPVLEAVAHMLSKRFGVSPFTLTDVGCGEGYYAYSLASRFPQATCFGMDLSRNGILQASRKPGVYWLVADLKKLPFASGSMDVVLDVLTPADYAAFFRVLKPNGILIKAIPGVEHLKEIRCAVQESLRQKEYASGRVQNHLEAHGEILEQITVHQCHPLNAAQSEDFWHMTPMTFSVPSEAFKSLRLNKITVHLDILCVKLWPESRVKV